jgi:acyl carrier protein
MSGPTADEILDDIRAILADFHGRVYLDSIERQTRFFADLGLASIDAVVLGETLEGHYGRTLPFGELMADLGRRPDRDLKIGELVDFLERHLDPRPAASAPAVHPSF